MMKNQVVLATLITALGGTFAATASAQEAAPAASAELSASAAMPEESSEEEEDRKDPMAWIGLGLKLGVGGVGSGEFDNPVYDPEAAAEAERLAELSGEEAPLGRGTRRGAVERSVNHHSASPGCRAAMPSCRPAPRQRRHRSR